MAQKKPEWRIYFFPDLINNSHIMFKHMKTNLSLKIRVGINFKFNENSVVAMMNHANQFIDENEKDIIKRIGDIPPKVCTSQIQNYKDFMIIYNGKTVLPGEKGLAVAK